MKVPCLFSVRRHERIAAILTALAAFATALPASAQSWVSEPPMPQPAAAAVSETINGIIYVAGGLNSSVNAAAFLQAYDPTKASNPWRSLSPIPSPLTYPAHGAINSKLHLVGGSNGSAQVNTHFIYDPASDTWTQGAPAPWFINQGASGVIDSKLYITGNSAGLPSLAVYDPATDSWKELHDSNFAHGAPASGVINGKLYVAGGTMPFTQDLPINVTEVYDPATDTWSELAPDGSKLAPMPTWVANAASVALNGLLFVIGGCTDSSTGCNVASAIVQAYDPVKNQWLTAPSLSLPTALNAPTASTDYGFIFLLGGSTAASKGTTTNERLPIPPYIP